MNRSELIKAIHSREIGKLTDYDWKDFNWYVKNLLGDYLHKCSDEELMKIEADDDSVD